MKMTRAERYECGDGHFCNWWPLVAGAALGAVGGLMGRDSNRTVGSSQSQSGQSQSTWHPHQATAPGYGFLAGNLQQLMQQPVPYFPGQTYVGPSQLTKQGVDLGQQANQYWQNAAGMGQGMANQYGQAAGGYNRAAGAMNQTLPYYGGAAQYGKAGAPMFGQAANSALGTMGQQNAVNNTSLGNFDFLSNAADVANNPYVRGMADTIQSRMNRNLMENQIPQINQGAMQANALGGSRQGLLQGQAVGSTNQAIGENLQNLYGQAYGQGLGAQQNALSQTGSMLGNLMHPAQSQAWAAQQYGNAMNQMGQAGDWATKGAQNLGQAADWMNQGGNALGSAQNAIAGSGNLMQQAQQNALGLGQHVEGYQGKALQDSMNRFSHQYQEPYQRMQNLAGLLGFLQPLGTQYGSSVGNASGQQPNPNYQSAMQGLFGGALGGLGMAGSFLG